jgi:hypothetical protein
MRMDRDDNARLEADGTSEWFEEHERITGH